MSAPEPQLVAAASEARLAEILQAQRELLARATSVKDTLAYAAELARRITGCEAATIFTQDGDDLVCRAAVGDGSAEGARLPATDSLTGLCFRSGELQLARDARSDPRVNRELTERLGTGSVLVVPLVSSRAVEGVLCAAARTADAFSDTDVQLMQVVGGIIGAALELAEVLQRAQKQTDEIWAALEEANRSEQTHRLLFEENPTPMFVYDPKTMRLLRANGAALALYGYQAAEFAGLDAFRLVAENDRGRLESAVVAANQGTHAGTWRHLRKDGGELVVRVVSRAFELEGRAARLIIVNDETGRRDAERKLAAVQHQLVQADKMASVGQLAAGVAHEINNPIGYVYSNLGTLGKYLEDLLSILDLYGEAEAALPAGDPLLSRIRARKQQVDLEFLREDLTALMGESREGITRVKKIVQDLKDFSHADQKDEWQTAELLKGLDSTLNIVHNELKYKCSVVKEYGELPEIECLPSQLNQVFMNLLVNAAHAIKEKGTITLRTAARAEEICVEVADSGCGIPQENLKRIFDPFFTTKPVGKGTGLGLSLAYGIVQKHGGRIEVESVVGQGTTFRVLLPRRRPLKAAA